MRVTKTKIEQLARALFPRHGLHDVGSFVATMVKYRSRDVYASVARPEAAAVRSKPGSRPPRATPPSPRRMAAQLDREIAEAPASPSALTRSSNLGTARTARLAAVLLAHESEAFRQYGQWNSVGVGRGMAGTWRDVVSFTDDGALVPPAGGSAYGTGNLWRGGPEHAAVEAISRWYPP